LGSMVLADGVLKMLMLKKLSIAVVVIASLATLTIGGGVAFVQTSRAQDAKSKAVPFDKNNAYLIENSYKALAPVDVDGQIQELLKLAHTRYEMKSELYDGGAIGVDPLISSAEQLEQVESSIAKSPAERKAAKQRHLARLKNIEARAEEAEKAGHVRVDELPGIKIRRMQAELELSSGDKENADLPAILRRLKELEQKVEQLEKRVPRGPGGRP
jgi:hypothetical protein